MGELEVKLRGLMKGQFSSLTIDFNDDHASNYEKAETWPRYEDTDWVSDGERDKALAENSVWTIQWYPNTPVGFNLLRASSLTALIDALPEEL
jgi:hypothetical protein